MGDEEGRTQGDGEQPDASSISDRARNGDGQEPEVEPLFVMGGDSPLTIDNSKLLERNARRVLEATVSMSAAEVPVDGLFKWDQEYDFLVRGEPGQVLDVPVKDPKTKRTKGIKKRQNIGVSGVQRADTPEAVRSLFGRILEANPNVAGALLDTLRADAEAVLAETPAAA